jgi:predicted ATPase/DNA-binding CsgD family transcriptional regulator
MARSARRLGNLPAAATSFLGRRRELAELRKRLSAGRLVSLVGPGGVGKTRLAIKMATDLARGFKDGAWLVELGEVQDQGLVPNAAMGALDLRDQASTEPLALVLAYLRDRNLLLVVDNCEHVLGAANQLVTEALKAAPGVRVMATSREPLSVPGEHVLPVPPLELPAADTRAPLSQLRQNEAVSLFVDRAEGASGAFELTTANRTVVVDLCRRLDGVPLAIELAAVRTRVLSAEQILDRLSDRFVLLTGGGRGAIPRQQTLKATIDWSHDLLEEAERTLMRRLCVFAGRFALADVEGVCISDGLRVDEGFELLASLVDKSLVVKEEANGLACFRLHETMREYAAAKLRAAGEQEIFEQRCAEYYRSRCQPAAAEARYELLAWLEWMDVEIDNIRSVLRRCIAHAEYGRGIDLAGSLVWYWVTRATTEGVRWLDELLASGSGSAAVDARAHFTRGFLAVLQSDPAAARPAFERALSAAEAAVIPTLKAHALSMASVAENMAGNREAAEELLIQARAVTDRLDDRAATLTVLQATAIKGLFDGNLEEIRGAASEGARLSREAGDLYGLEMMLISLGCAALMEGDHDESGPFFVEALRIAQQIDDRVAQFYLLEALVCRAAGAGQSRLAAQLLGAGEVLRAGTGANRMAMLVPLLSQAEESVVASLGAAKFDSELNVGRMLSRDAAMKLALGQSFEAAAAPDDVDAGLLGKREAEVAHLVAEGLTNKQIGARLFISEHTVDSHIRNILNKLGFNSRAQIARWTVSNR